MPVGLADLREARTPALRSAGQAWWDYAGSLRELAERVTADVAGALHRSGWEDTAAEVADERSEQLRQHFEVRSRAAELVAAVYDSAYHRLWRLQWQVTVTVDAASSAGMSVRPDGVVEPPPPTAAEQLVDGGLIVQQRSRRARELTEQIAGIVAQADAVDQQTAGALTSLDPEHCLTGGGWAELAWDAQELATEYGLSDHDIPDGDDPAANAAWWAGLTAAERAMYLAAYPRLIGGLDGLPVASRDRANQLGLRYTLDSPAASDISRARAQDLLDRIAAAADGPADQRLYLIGYDLAGDGQAIISVGDPDTAAHTAVWVPGVDSTIDNIGGDLQRVRNLQAEADRMTATPGDVATVMWLGYDAPGFDLSAVGGDRARAGAPALDSFIDGLRASDGVEGGRITVIGHSYGSRVVGEAATAGDGLAVDDIITAGSPGMGIYRPFGGAGQLQLDPRHVWAGAAEGDHVSGWMSRAAHGVAPHYERFGANRFEVDTTGHSDYWQRDTVSLENQAAIIVGAYDEVTLEHGKPPE